MKLYQLALLSAITAAAAQQHNHVHRHPARHGSPVEARDAAVTATIPGPIVTVYELNGEDISYSEVQQGLKNGKYVLIGDKISTVIAPSSTIAPTTSSTPKPSPKSSEAAQFFQKPASVSSKSSVSPTPTPTPTPAPAPAPAPASSSSSSSESSSSSSGNASSDGNINAEFPSGKIPCSTFPSAYGAVPIDYLGLEGWTGVQQTPNYASGDSAISYIVTAIAGSGGCTKNSFCSYACPAGYQKSQWPSAQGNTGQSIGGLYCDSNGMLELSRPSVPQICISGAGGVEVTNKLNKNVAICRTDYPGLEAETIPLNTQPGQTYPLCNPDANTYYTWEGSATSAQYYINPSGADVEDACVWGSAGTNLGNWAPVNAGVGKGADGNTYISLFPNAPTNPDGTLDFTITITGDVSGNCKYSSGTYYNNGVQSATGCTVGVTSGGTAVFEFS